MYHKFVVFIIVLIIACTYIADSLVGEGIHMSSSAFVLLLLP
jgi:hypothetical protein